MATAALLAALVACYGGFELFTAFGSVPSLAAAGILVVGVVIFCLSLAAINRTKEMEQLVESAHAEVQEADRKRKLASTAGQDLAAGLGCALLMCKRNGAILEANQAARAMFGMGQGETRSLLEETLSFDIQKTLEQAAITGDAQRVGLTLSFPKERNVECAVWRRGHSNDEYFVSIHDQTELTRARRMRSDFVANASHELRTPMAILRSMAQTVAEDETLDGDTRARYLKSMIAEVDRLTLITQDLLTLSEAESQAAILQECDLSSVARYVAEHLGREAESSGLRLKIEIEPAITVLGDAAQLTIAFINLVSNAIRYTDEGSVTISLKRVEQGVCFEVADTGIGIASEHLPRIFERFYRVDRARSRETGGTGLGLSIVKHIIEAHGGTLEVQSDLHVGSRFRVLLVTS